MNRFVNEVEFGILGHYAQQGFRTSWTLSFLKKTTKFETRAEHIYLKNQIQIHLQTNSF